MEILALSELRKDRSRFDVGRKRSGKSGKSANGRYNAHDTNLYRPIIAIDGEGITDADGEHRYVMLACHDQDGCCDSSHIQAKSLNTVQCFEFLLNLPKKHLIVGFSIGYDICKWIRSLPKRYLEELGPSASGSVTWKGYTIKWAPTKYISLRHKDGRRVFIYDVFGFYQRSFVAALEEWKVGTDEQVERIKAMKASRSTFSNESLEEMLGYCLEECQLLVQLVQKLRDALIEGEIPIRQWYGAGAVAAAILEKENVKQYLLRQPPEKYSIPILSAYYGGRFELSESGEHQNVWLYDIRSAYPHIARTLPCITHMIYREEKGYAESEWGIYYCTWDVGSDAKWPPFPFREEKSGRILYPTNGSGWYHSSEVAAALRLYPGGIRIERSLVCTSKCPSDCASDPFGFIPRYFAYRNILKARGSQAQLTLKLGLNAMYGKCAQGVGFGEKKPPFQSYLWAAMMTAGTRAMMLDCIRQNPDAIIWTATDGIGSKVRLQVDVGNELGQWEERHADWAFCIQPGVYQYSIDGKVSVATRGFGKSETNFDEIKAAYVKDPAWGHFKYKTTRFCGLGASLARTDFWRYFGKWIEHERRVSFCPEKRYPDVELDEIGVPPIRLLPQRAPESQAESAPYTPKSQWSDMWTVSPDDEMEKLLDQDMP